jgi:hypothetical protein
MMNRASLFTFSLIDGRRVTYAGANEAAAFNLAREYHGAAVEQVPGAPAQPCARDHEISAGAVRQAGFLICRCGGYLG